MKKKNLRKGEIVNVLHGRNRRAIDRHIGEWGIMERLVAIPIHC
jgi:hypothetical protein